MRTSIAIAALLLGACASPEDAFVGLYSGSHECSGSFDDGTPYTEGPNVHQIRIDRALDGSIFIAGSGCRIPLRVISATRAELVHTACDVTLPSGIEVRATYEAGAVTLLEPQLASTQSNRIVARDGTWSLLASCVFDGSRIE